ncbi:hypothetical protein GEOBRER4_n1272 [Citrifermentans bremense]|uniref:Rhodanese domain-containing protein n=1 Tax=Citrifermentans bremense TaxID=60035 RepID=A0A6S6M528_9BACT|nr:rhodanese-like domain-containing protein [Citrifermentans bremense]BCG46475.1 hypothetical protein GEOBRER4_n1272 [Citrifermentans bremense]
MKRLLIYPALSLALVSTAIAASYNYVEPTVFKTWLEGSKPVKIVDIQVPEEFRKHHFKNSLETNAYPVKSAEDKKKLDAVLPQLTAGREDIVIVCPRGGGGAKNTYDHLKGKGIEEKRLFILEDGMQGWPFKQLTLDDTKK